MLIAVLGLVTIEEITSPAATPTKGGEEHPGEIGEEHLAYSENRITDNEVNDTLDQGEKAQRDIFANDVSCDSESVMPLPHEQGPITDDFFGRVGHAEEESHNEAEEEIGGDVKGIGEIVVAVLGIAQDHRDEES